MPPIKFQLNLTYGLGGDVFEEEFQWRPSWNSFSNSESLCHCNASNQVSAQSNLRFGRRCHLRNLKMASWISKWNDFSNSESLCQTDASHQVSAQSD